MPYHLSFVLALLVLLPQSRASHQVLLGPAFPAPSNLAGTDLIHGTASNLESLLGETLARGRSPFGNFTANSTSLSLTIVARENDEPFSEFQFSSPSLNTPAGSVAQVVADSVFRIGSVSKLFTVYALLLNQGAEIWSRPVTDFIPELRDYASQNFTSIDQVHWEQVTVGALASQLSGIGRDYNNADLASQPYPWTELGLPVLPSRDIPSCAGNESLPPCSRSEYFRGFVQRHPVFAPYTTPIYSNAAFRILGYVLEAITNSSYEEAMKKSVWEPLGLTNTSASRPARGVIPSGDSGWFLDLGEEAPTGGLYSSTKDLAAFGRAILNHKQLSPLATRQWMKPHSHTSSLTFSVGAPWEISRALSDGNSGRVIDLYTKSGSTGQYQSLLVLVPDFQVVLSLCAAGPDSDVVITDAAETALQTFLPVLEHVARTQACERFCGTYENTTSNSSLVLDVDDGPGLVVRSWISLGVDLVATAQAYAKATNGGVISSIRLYPTDLHSDTRNSRLESYRALIETINPSVDPAVRRIIDPNANQWDVVDNLMYGEIAIDDIVFHLDGSGTATAVEPRVLRQVFEKVTRSWEESPMHPLAY